MWNNNADYTWENKTRDRLSNVGSYSTALKNGMKLVDEFNDPVNTITKVYAITREEWALGLKASK